MSMLLGRRAVMAGLAGALATPALAQARFPDRPIRMMVPWTPGGATDIQMRALCEQAARRLG
ncbi:MAG: tripartite tricarboxylate transporter substrate binding protein, partial [Alphaproteobacteria bacterium]